MNFIGRLMEIIDKLYRPERFFIDLALLLVILICLWYVLREVKCWYYKIDERIQLLHSINNKLEIIIQNNISMDNSENQTNDNEI